MDNFVEILLDTGNVHLENNLYVDDIIVAGAATGTYRAGALLVRSGADVDFSGAISDAHVALLSHDVEHVTGTASPARVLYSGGVREDHVFLGNATTPVVLDNPARDILRAVGINPIRLTELNG